MNERSPAKKDKNEKMRKTGKAESCAKGRLVMKRTQNVGELLAGRPS